MLDALQWIAEASITLLCNWSHSIDCIFQVLAEFVFFLHLFWLFEYLPVLHISPYWWKEDNIYAAVKHSYVVEHFSLSLRKRKSSIPTVDVLAKVLRMFSQLWLFFSRVCAHQCKIIAIQANVISFFLLLLFFDFFFRCIKNVFFNFFQKVKKVYFYIFQNVCIFQNFSGWIPSLLPFLGIACVNINIAFVLGRR